MAIAQSILDAQTKLTASVAALSSKVDALLAAPTMTPADVAAVAQSIATTATTVDAITAKVPA